MVLIMNWETYKSLTDEQRLEYDYKYKNKDDIIINVKALTSIAIYFMLTCTLLMSMMLIGYHVDDIPIGEEELKMYTMSLGDVIEILGPLIVCTGLYYLAFMVWNRISEQRWIRKNNIIKKGKWWQK